MIRSESESIFEPPAQVWGNQILFCKLNSKGSQRIAHVSQGTEFVDLDERIQMECPWVRWYEALIHI